MPMTEKEAESIRAYLKTISPARLKSVKWPKHDWQTRAKAFGLFGQGLTPMNISPKLCRVKRRTLYKYFEDWKLLDTQAALRRYEWRQEQEVGGNTSETLKVRQREAS